MGIYERVPYVVGAGNSVLQCGRKSDKKVKVRPNLPGNVIVIHGVNDVGTSYHAVEKGLCAGLKSRLGQEYVAGTYRLPIESDKGKLEEDPDDVFFKRKIDENTHSPVIPFYWGSREMVEASRTVRGQKTDRYGNRLDKDLSKETGSFANATSTLPDMWGKGKSQALGLLDWAQQDATHPVLNNPGRLYMILAAKRLAALIAMIRDYDANEVVTLVAHSQGCMLSLLAQAFLKDDGLRPADTLILNNPPYSLVDDIPITTAMVEHSSGEDAIMQNDYRFLDDRQTLHARLQTLVNIVHFVVNKKHQAPAFESLTDQCKHHGIVSARWKPGADRDNRGKVYLYFCPEDMTVSLNNVQGIGWQGVPDFQRGRKLGEVPELKRGLERINYPTGRMVPGLVNIVRQPMKEITARNSKDCGFFQRVFTTKLRPDPHTGNPVLVGQSKPHDYILRTPSEDDQAHTEVSDSTTSKRFVRAHLPEPVDFIAGKTTVEQQRSNIRVINGEPLPVAVRPSLMEGAGTDGKGREGALEDVDQIDAAIAVTSDYGMKSEGIWQRYPDPTTDTPSSYLPSEPSPHPLTYQGRVQFAGQKFAKVKAALNKSKLDAARTEVLAVYECVGASASVKRFDGTLLVHRTETQNEARLRWQQASSPRSFHGAIIGGVENHRQVTAYDIAIGGGKASTDPLFYRYLCSVADWRLKDAVTTRPSIMKWSTFLSEFAVFWKSETPARRSLIEGTMRYYSMGILPESIQSLSKSMPSSVVCETLNISAFQSKKVASTKPIATLVSDNYLGR